MKPGDLVNYKPGQGQLVCGSGAYDCAVVVSVDPFVLISPEGDMRWSATIVGAQDKFEVINEASRDNLLNVMNRLFRDSYLGKE